MENVIILTRMYVGSYLQNHIGHEIINLFRDDNGDNYIYINALYDYTRLNVSNNEKQMLFNEIKSILNKYKFNFNNEDKMKLSYIFEKLEKKI